MGAASHRGRHHRQRSAHPPLRLSPTTPCSGRRIGEPGNYKGTSYIASEFKRLGLKPAGDSGTFYQVLPFGPIGFDSSSATLSVGGRALARQRDWIPTTPTLANGFGGAASLNGVPAVYAGVWGDSTVMLDAAAYRGKVLVFSAAPSTGRVAASSGAPASFVSCADVPDKFGANASIAEEARQRANPSAPAARRAVPTGCPRSARRRGRCRRRARHWTRRHVGAAGDRRFCAAHGHASHAAAQRQRARGRHHFTRGRRTDLRQVGDRPARG
ncbi:hypothetical protein [Gemmatimonas sp.]|uniref:hypothetical protein n=1 Tax=Gemmatimonas sp. TaxID=1962908 RepID=UPI003DA378EB